MKKIFIILFLLATAANLQSQTLYIMPDKARSRVSSMENLNGVKGNGGKTNAGAKGSAATSLKAGETKTLLDVHTGGIIQRMWFTINDRSPEMLRSLRLRMYWDNADKPAVDVPFGDFFGCTVGRMVPYESHFFSSPEGRSFNCYIPMPFAKAARVVLSNESKKDLDLLFFDIDFIKTLQPDKKALYFHAVWHRTNDTTLGKDVELLPRVHGMGRLLGVSVGVNVNPVYGDSWWGEGEVKMYIDGDTDHPTINGTGAEDYIGTGWGEGSFAHAYQGCLIADGKGRQYEFYRWHVPDEIWFYKDCRVCIQQIGGWPAPKVLAMQAAGIPLRPISVYSNKKGFRGLMEKGAVAEDLAHETEDDWMNFYRTDDYSVTAYFYLDQAGGTQNQLRTVIKLPVSSF